MEQCKIPAVLVSVPLWVGGQKEEVRKIKFPFLEGQGHITVLPDKPAKMVIEILRTSMNSRSVVDPASMLNFSTYRTREKLEEILNTVKQFGFGIGSHQEMFIKECKKVSCGYFVSLNSSFFKYSQEKFGDPKIIDVDLFYSLHGKQIRLYLYLVGEESKTVFLDYRKILWLSGFPRFIPSPNQRYALISTAKALLQSLEVMKKTGFVAKYNFKFGRVNFGGFRTKFITSIIVDKKRKY